MSVYRSNDRTQFTFDTPSAAALHLNSAWKAAARATQLKQRVTLDPAGIQPGLVCLSVSKASLADLFDYFEEMIAVAFGSFAAVEAFCNQTIVEKGTTPITVKNKKAEIQLSAEEIESQRGTREKLSRILPDLLRLPTPSGKAVWQRFVRLEDLRDAVTHFKRRDQARKVTSEPTALFRLYTEDLLLAA